MEKDKKPSVKSAAGLSMVVVLFTLMFSMNETRSEIVEIMLFLCVLFMAGCAIYEWVRYLRKYVDFAIEQKLSGHN